jgi:hypothetical protein
MEKDFITPIRMFLKAEYDAIIAAKTEPNDSKFQSKIAEYQVFFSSKLNPIMVAMYRPETLDDEWFLNQKEILEDITPRKLFLVRIYQHPEYDLLYKCYVSGNYKNNLDYSAIFYFGKIDSDLKIIAYYLRKRNRTGWDWSGGKRFKDFGKFVTVQRFLAPANVKDLSDYESDKG